MAPPPERYVAPVLVLGLHFLLVSDIAAHKPALSDFSRPLTVLEWFMVCVTVTVYLFTVFTDPGYLRQGPTKPSCLAVACVVAVEKLRGSGKLSGDPSASARDVRATRNAEELEPIGRSVLDAVEGDVDEDPGEEEIDFTDLEKAHNKGKCLDELSDATQNQPNGAPRRKRKDIFNLKDGDVDPDTGKKIVMQSGQRLRYCNRCSMHQPLRTKHCRDCGRCVRTHDHHCPWVGTCVGEGNRVYFYWFLVAQSAELLAFCLEGVSVLSPVGAGETPFLLVMGLIVIGLFLVMVSCLLSYHTYLAIVNVTTWESISWHHITYLRSIAPEDGSPFSQGVMENLFQYCGQPWLLWRKCWVRCERQSTLKRTEDGWAVWDLGDPRNPAEVDCTAWGCGRVNLCSCFDM
eukprot:TRINITY_DN75692_c0_g1_i1.p1 TRINITY_DN75692_c0_g1~~TRINITY_DN75692_c0_g1_i1.p1  ORF type:complete len:403 (+),score=74.92 TRINITY_DN75692_c0_g1_i1:190-1398(+)